MQFSLQKSIAVSALLLATTGMVQHALAQATPPSTSTQRITAGRFAVKEFKTADGLGNSIYGVQPIQLSNAIADMLVTEMTNAGFDMLERGRLNDALDEQDLGASGRVDRTTAAPIGSVIGAQYLIVGTITEWGIKEQQGNLSTFVRGDLGQLGGHKSDARVAINYRVIDAATGKVLAAGEAKASESNFGIGVRDGRWKGIDLSQKEWTQSQIGKATRKAVGTIAKKLKQTYPAAATGIKTPVPIEARIVLADTSDECIINGGAAVGLKVGDTLEIFRVKEVKDTDGSVVYRDETKLGTATVLSVQETGAKIRITAKEPGITEIQAGDKVRKSPH